MSFRHSIITTSIIVIVIIVVAVVVVVIFFISKDHCYNGTHLAAFHICLMVVPLFTEREFS